MKTFVRLFEELDSTTSTNEKIEALKRYFKTADAEDSMWTVLLLTARASKKILTARDLRNLFLTATKYPEWLYEECHDQVGDTAETLSLLAQSLGLCQKEEPETHSDSLTVWIEKKIPDLAKTPDSDERSRILLSWWKNISTQEVFLLNKLMTGAFRVGVSEKIVVRALSEVHEIPTDHMAHRLSGIKTGGKDAFAKLVSREHSGPAASQPYPFCLAHGWTDRVDDSWKTSEWCVEWKYDGIRAQVLARENKFWIWSRGEDEITAAFPDIVEALKGLPDGTVLDGEILVIRDGRIQSFQDLQKRLGRKKVSAQIQTEFPAGFIAYDCLEYDAQDIRDLPLAHRKKILRKVLEPFLGDRIFYSQILEAKELKDLEDLRAQSRENEAEGLMIKAWQGPYSVGRKTGNWWKHKVDPLTLDAVLLYAQAGNGRRANLYTDYTFALWDDQKHLVPFAKAYSGLDQKEINELDQWIRFHTKEKFGPVRAVEAHFVFEIGFEGISRSKRHKSGIAVRFPRILRWRKDKKPEEADTLETAEHLLDAPEKLT